MLKRHIPTFHAKNIYEIDLNKFVSMGIKYVFCDLDNTLDSYRQKTPTPKAVEFKEKLNKLGIELIIVSNNTGNRVKLYSETLGVPYFSRIGKPFIRRINKIIKEKGYSKDEIISIGDQVVTDISFANKAGIKNILTDKLVKEDQPTTHFNRLFDRPLRRCLKKKNLLKEF